MSVLALQLIAEAKRTNAKVLDLGNCSLTKLPDTLFKLVQLEELNLCNEYWDYELKRWIKCENKGKPNKINEISERIGSLKKLNILRLYKLGISNVSFLEKLTRLQKLDLRSNHISDISYLEKMKELRTLYLHSNQISDISFLKKLTKLRMLDLSKNQISDISYLEKLTRLQTLDLRSNQISDISYLEKLKGLQTLHLHSNQISDISFLEKLTGLQKLDLSSNQISNVTFLEKLTGLQRLDFSSNQISDISFLERLIGLQKLDLSSNQISDISFLEKLINLQRLNLSSNQIIDIKPILGLIENGMPAVWEWEIKSIVLKDNPLKSPPPEIVKQGNAPILNWFKANKKALSELKLILIGDPQAGKTSILQMLVENKFVKEQLQTDGINIESLRFKDLETFKDYTALQSIIANCWDFGGQETMNATHQFFMTKRCVYVLVLNARKDNQVAQQVKNWVSRITATGGNSAIIVLVNQIDVNPGFGFENEQELKAEFPQIKYFLKTSCANGQGIEELKQCLAELIPKAELFNTQIDERWFPIKEKLQQETGALDFLNESRFRQICADNGITEKEAQKELIYFLNDLGIVLHFDNRDLAEYFVLDPYWLTYGIYQIITSKYVAKNEGIIDLGQMEFVINEEHDKAKAYKAKNYRKINYSTNERRYLLDFMAEYKLVFYSHCRTKIIIPDVLTTSEPNAVTEPIRSAANKIQFVYSYPYLPKSILPNFMADMNTYLTHYWRTGCLLKRGDEMALVSTYDNRLTITVTGVHKQKREFLAVVRSHLQIINSNQNQRPKRLIPLPGIKNSYVGYDELLKREKRETIYYHYGEVEAEFEISKLLEGIIYGDELQQMVKELLLKQKQNFNPLPNTKKIFISYSNEDVEMVEKRLIRSLKNLERQNKITIWYDKNLQAGEEWDPEIKRQLQEANIILFMVSPDFIATDYIWDVEITKAIERHKRGEAKVIPIICRPCDWKGDATPLSKLHVIPAKGQPITTFENQDEAWLEVLKAIKKVI